MSLITRNLLITVVGLLLAGCDLLGLGPDPRIAQREADAKAIGGACRHGMRSIEDCYTLNKGIAKSSIYAGWREMDEYMRENKLEGVRPEIQPAPPPAPAAPAEEIIQEPKAKAKKG
jgi:hypothetical protein